MFLLHHPAHEIHESPLFVSLLFMFASCLSVSAALTLLACSPFLQRIQALCCWGREFSFVISFSSLMWVYYLSWWGSDLALECPDHATVLQCSTINTEGADTLPLKPEKTSSILFSKRTRKERERWLLDTLCSWQYYILLPYTCTCCNQL